ncbi:fungal-specific transcription factor domain-containing protein [Xylaria bambusicola]|uniref:fungal-specific transcription factor domain-containing protein n=1 Tax=Xylaria bambusicola TaxID=326684 RepID=UPI0020089CC6|nr:fungal-specific transcription factor domain-containing protein [Xylaria bambusicola]KAI0509076.1 fungal-specific transcription factor domain-containing protein [Xylaria bambusicola]
MPPGRPPKRPGDADIAVLDVLGNPSSPATKCKLPRLDQRSGRADFSSVVKSKLQSYTRTGQACDRCKVRKIRCDALPEGCSHCINQNLECYVTDRVSGRTERRGYMQELEREKTDMMTHIRDMERKLRENGIDVKPWHSSSFPADAIPNGSTKSDGNDTSNSTPTPTPQPQPSPQEDTTTKKEPWSQPSAPTWSKDRPAVMSMAANSQNSAGSRPADAHLGVGIDQAPLSSIKGTSLSILGSTIDIGSLDVPDMDEPPASAQGSSLYNKSVQALQQSIMNINQPLAIKLPPRQDAFNYAEWYFVMIHPFHPVLHKPSFMALLGQHYDNPNFTLSAAEEVMIHMVFAAIYLQYGIRNREQSAEQRAHLNDLSNKHYHYGLSKFFYLITSRTLKGLQALSMLVTHTMRFPKPDSSSILASYAVNLAIEMGYHRVWKKPGEGTNLENELRKRVWWVILSTAVVLNGRMGRPMPIRLEDMDVEFPQLIPDEQLTEHGVDTSIPGRCDYDIGVASSRMATLYLEMFADIYCAQKDPKRYLAIVEGLEKQLQSWREHLPEGLRIGDAQAPEKETRMSAIYASVSALEFRLCLRHPSVAATDDPEILATNTRICGEVAKAMLQHARKLYKLKCLDTTWYCNAVYVAAIFSDLVAHWDRRHDITASEVQSLREDMKTWLTILAETGTLMGSGTRLRDAVCSIIDRTIAWIERDRLLNTTNGNLAPSHASPDVIKRESHSPSYTNMSINSNSSSNMNNTPERMNDSKEHSIPISSNNYYPETNTSNSNTYQPLNNYANTTTHAPNGISYDPSTSYMYSQAAGPVTNAQAQVQVQAEAQVRAQAQAQVQAHTQAQVHAQAQHSQVHVPSHNPLASFASQATQVTPPDVMWRPQSSGGNTWHDWTAAVVDSQDRYSANALMSLGGANNHRPSGSILDGSNDAANSMSVGTMSMSNPTLTSSSAQMQWPLLLFTDGVGGV